MPLPLETHHRSTVVDLTVRRTSVEAAVRAVVEAPVRHLPVALLDALRGAWGTPEELGLVVPRALAR